jgi:hypothetical protein
LKVVAKLVLPNKKSGVIANSETMTALFCLAQTQVRATGIRLKSMTA